MTPEPPGVAGWYDDATDAALLRYWDGAKWSPHTAPRPTDAAGAAVSAVELDEATTVRTIPQPRAPEEHTTVPLPSEQVGPAASGRRTRLAWIVGAALLALALASGTVWGAVARLHS